MGQCYAMGQRGQPLTMTAVERQLTMTEISKHYAPFFKGWQVKALGPRPTDEMLTTAHAFGRAGKQSLALAMAMRDCGVTGGQVVMACGAPQNNHRIAQIKSGFFKRDLSVPKADGVHTVYKLTITAKGEGRVKKAAEAEANAALDAGDKPKAKKAASKPRKPKAAKPEATQAPVSEPAVSDAPVTDTTAQA